MQDRPDMGEMIQAVAEFLRADILPALTDARQVFQLKVALNALAIVGRQIETGARTDTEEHTMLSDLLRDTPEAALDPSVAGMNRQLAERIRAGATPAGALATLKKIAVLKLSIASPRTLTRDPGMNGA